MDAQTSADMAGELMRSTLDSWRTGNRRFAVFHAGLGCEHALKAYLSHLDPVLVADTHTDQALRYRALGLDDKDGVKPLTEARTISMERAFKDAEKFMRGRMPVTKQQFDALAQSRNGLTHLAWYNTTLTKQAVATGIQIAEAVRAELGIRAATFWGDYETVFNDLAKIKAMPAPASALPKLQAAAETLAKQEAEQARRAAHTAAIVAHHTATKEAARAALWTALQVTGLRARDNAIILLETHGILPLDPRPDRSHAPSPASALRAHDAIAIKALVASSIHTTFTAACEGHEPLREALPDILSRKGRTIPHRQCEDSLYLVECHACGMLANIYGHTTQEFCDCDDPDVWEYIGGECPNHPHSTINVDHAELYHCPTCSFTLSHDDELEAAGIPLSLDRDR
ncbi:hypothetical protein [Streptomyces antimycoticus]|uniref:hypothetical protein n=1 Tax=Streptomyces antimycoticus TaxID=68175 RepID=UPI00117D84C7|nr:hypothetical protein [Streptomyces antimycoticus]